MFHQGQKGTFSPWLTLEQLRLPRGSYVVFARVVVDSANGRNNRDEARCQLRTDRSVVDAITVSLAPGEFEAIPLTGAVGPSRSGSSLLQLQCYSPGVVFAGLDPDERAVIRAGSSRITAVRVGEIG